MRVLISYHLIQEVLLNRPGFVEDANQVWELMRSGQIEGYITQRGLDIIYLHLEDSEGVDKAEKKIANIKEVLGICPINSSIREQARVSNLDYESAVELVCAINSGFDAIVTQHPQSFDEDDSLVIAVTELLDQIKRGESTFLEIIKQLNRSFYHNEPLQLSQFHPLEVDRYLTYRIRNSIATVLKAFEIIKKEGNQGIDRNELARKAKLSEKTTNSVVLDLQNFHMAFRQQNRIVAQQYLFGFGSQQIIGYLAETLKSHVVTQEVYKRLNPGEIMTRWRLQELIAAISPKENSIIPKSSSDYTSKMLPWFFFTGLLEDRGNGRIARPTGEGKQKGKLKEETDAQQLELFEVSVSTQITLSPSRCSAIDLLDELPGQRLFKTPEEADRYLQEERRAWES
jgi:hypothetical protein